MDITYLHPTLEDLIKREISNPEEIFEIQQETMSIFSTSLKAQYPMLWFGNTYSLRPNVYFESEQEFTELIKNHGESLKKNFFGPLGEKIRESFADIVGISDPNRVCLGVNATTFVSQILSNYWGRTFKILSTNTEFPGVTRVLNALKEIENIEVFFLDAKNIKTFEEQLISEAFSKKYDVLVMSDVPYNFGTILPNIAEIIEKIKHRFEKIIIDGSTSFWNIPVKEVWGKTINDIYYIGCPKKFLCCGEGFNVMIIPEKCEDRPIFTGWFVKDGRNADFLKFPNIHPKNHADIYCNGTLDWSSRYRFLKIYEHYNKIGYTFEKQYKYRIMIQEYFLKKLEEKKITFLGKHNLRNQMGKFRPLQTCFDMSNSEITPEELNKILSEKGILETSTGETTRFCIGVYHTVFDIERLVEELYCIEELIKKRKEKN